MSHDKSKLTFTVIERRNKNKQKKPQKNQKSIKDLNDKIPVISDEIQRIIYC